MCPSDTGSPAFAFWSNQKKLVDHHDWGIVRKRFFGKRVLNTSLGKGRVVHKYCGATLITTRLSVYNFEGLH